MKKTLGGERLGNGKKIKVDLHGWGRSTFDQSRVWRSTMAPGALVPCFVELGLNGSTFDIDINALGHTIPTISPLFGSFKLQVDVFACPLRLYQGLLHNNAVNIGLDMDEVLIPKIILGSPTNRKNETNPSSLLSYLGIKGFTQEQNEFNAIPLLAYYDIFKNYYSNKQEEYAKVITWELEDMIPVNITSIETTEYFESGNTLTTSPLYEESNTNIYLFRWNSAVQAQLWNSKTIIYGTFKTLEEMRMKTGNVISYVDFSKLYDGRYKILENQNDTQVGWFQYNEEKCIIEFNYSEFGVAGIARFDEINFLNREMKQIIKDFPLENIDQMRRNILKLSDIGERLELNTNQEELGINTLIMPYRVNYETANIDRKWKNLNGLCVKTYQNDIFNTWLSNDHVELINSISSIMPNENGEITMDAFILAKKVYNVLNRIAVSGGTYEDWQESVYGENAIRKAESPIYLGGMSSEITFEEVVSTAATENQPLATLGGKGVMTGKKGGNIVYKCGEPCFIIGIASITPRVDYFQGNKWYMTQLNSINDLHKPGLDGIGFENLIANKVVWSDSINKSLAKQPAWMDYQTAFNEVFGNFALRDDEENTLHHMVLRRNYEVDENGEITDFTSYIDPAKFNYAFADNSLTAQNFWLQLGFKCIARRKMASYEIPNL